MREAFDINVHGIVQGVGFRPFVYRIAHDEGIKGWVLNGVGGVQIHAEGDQSALGRFVRRLSDEAPAAAQVREIGIDEGIDEGFDDFSIRASDQAEAQTTTLVSPDLGMCAQCEAELLDPADRRYHYPFINCTNCGPRFTIINSLPYDRPRTSMGSFEMCPDCAREYADPANRRFHAQPDACFTCGPHISWQETHDTKIEWGDTLEKSDAIIDRAAAWLADGRILAVKGLGGFHLVCDATNAQAIATLRERKRRPNKPFAVMVGSLDEARTYCQVSDAEAKLMEGPVRPIVLLHKRRDASITAGLADGLDELGLMLPSTPLQRLLIDAAGTPLVMTSGNVHGEPIQTDDGQALYALGDIADAFVGNNRPIVERFDDSVVRVLTFDGEDALQVIRRARGYAPRPVKLETPDASGDTSSPSGTAPVVFACGPEQKNTFTLLRGSEAFVSQHIGDMENADTYDAWLAGKAAYERLFDAKPQVIACDMHPEYLTDKWAAEQHETAGTPLVKVQHHHAHIVSAMAENGLDEAVCGIAFDGTGYGYDGAIWGGEVLLANRRDYERFANLAYMPMPGGAAAIEHPLRMAYGLLWSLDLLDHPGAAQAIGALGSQADVCRQMIEQGINTPMTSSMGRLLDAISALLGVCTEPTYEGEAAIALEGAIGGWTHGWNLHEGLDDDASMDAYHFAMLKNSATAESTAMDTSVVLLDPEPLVHAVLDDIATGVPTATISRRVHDAVVEVVVQAAQLVNAAYGISKTVLAGGVFMNRYIVEHATVALRAAGMTVVLNKDLPPNDGGVSYGEAACAAARLAHAEARTA